MKQKGLAPILIILVIALGIGSYLIYSGKINFPQKQIACTLEAKICPDETSVGRSGPKCEFTPCPSPKVEEEASWKAYTNIKYGFSFKYPENMVVDVYDDAPRSFTLRLSKGLKYLEADFALTIMTKQYDQDGYVGISLAEYERALKNAALNQIYQDPNTKRNFIFLGKKIIDGKEFSILKIQVISDTVAQSKDELFSTEAVGLVGDNLYRFPADSKDLTNQILATLKFTN